MSDDLFDHTCGECAHYIERNGEQQGSCYRYPPTPLPISMQQKARVATSEPQALMAESVVLGAMYAPVNRKTLGCGEFELMEIENADNN